MTKISANSDYFRHSLSVDAANSIKLPVSGCDMSECSACGRDLPGYEQLCRECYATQYADLTAPQGSLWHRFLRALNYILDPRLTTDNSEIPESTTDLSSYSWSAYKHLLPWLFGEVIVAVFFYAFFAYMPDFSKALMAGAAYTVTSYDIIFWKSRRRRSRATPLFWFPVILGTFCGVMWKIGGEDVWGSLGLAMGCLLAVYIVIDRWP